MSGSGDKATTLPILTMVPPRFQPAYDARPLGIPGIEIEVDVHSVSQPAAEHVVQRTVAKSATTDSRDVKDAVDTPKMSDTGSTAAWALPSTARSAACRSRRRPLPKDSQFFRNNAAIKILGAFGLQDVRLQPLYRWSR